jgi:histidinol-phosphate aminotransferase
MTEISSLVRPHLLQLKPYSTARDEYAGEAKLFLDANESPYNLKLNRYPDPKQSVLRNAVAAWKGVNPECVFTGNGSDEAIDLLLRAFCEPAKDAVLIMPPTYGMYAVAANTHGIKVDELLLDENFQPDFEKLVQNSSHHKILFLCSPNNPTGNLIKTDILEKILQAFSGLVVVDEAYADFSAGVSNLTLLKQFPRLIVLQTFSKALGLAAARVGMAFAHKDVIEVLDRIKLPYNMNALSLQAAMKRLKQKETLSVQIKSIIRQREKLMKSFGKLPFVLKVFPSEANFVLIKVHDSNQLYDFLAQHGIIVRNRSNQPMLENCLRITVGNAQQNKLLIKKLKQYNL